MKKALPSVLFFFISRLLKKKKLLTPTHCWINVENLRWNTLKKYIYLKSKTSVVVWIIEKSENSFDKAPLRIKQTKNTCFTFTELSRTCTNVYSEYLWVYLTYESVRISSPLLTFLRKYPINWGFRDFFFYTQQTGSHEYVLCADDLAGWFLENGRGELSPLSLVVSLPFAPTVHYRVH